MKKIILLVLLSTSTLFAQKLTKAELTDKMSDLGCECASKQEITKENMELTLGLCILEAINKYEKDVEKYYGKNVVSSDKKMEELGYDIGLKMGAKCPTVFQFMMEDDATEAYEEEEPDAMIEGTLIEIKSEQFLTFSVKQASGKMDHFILLNNFENAFLVTDNVLKTNDSVAVYYYEFELYDAKLAKFITFNVVTDLIKK